MLVSIRARTGQRMRTFLRAVSLLSELNAFEASTISITSVPSSSNRFLIAWIPACCSCPARSCLLPTAFRISSRATLRMALEMRCLSVSPTPIGLTLGHLSRAIRHQASGQKFQLGQRGWSTFSWLAWPLSYVNHLRHCEKKNTCPSRRVHIDLWKYFLTSLFG